MENQFSRTEMLLGADGLARLQSCRVAVFGLGGVGGYAAEALARSGIGALDLVDHDSVSLSNLNRQILALHSTVGEDKVDLAEKRIRDIAPQCTVRKYKNFFLPETADSFDFSVWDCVVDAIDTVSGKIEIARKAAEAGIPLISVMGTGNKLDPTKLHVTDLEETHECPLARVMRRECRKRGITGVTAVWSDEPPMPHGPAETDRPQEGPGRKDTPGSMIFVPAAAGLAAASAVIRKLLNKTL